MVLTHDPETTCTRPMSSLNLGGTGLDDAILFALRMGQGNELFSDDARGCYPAQTGGSDNGACYHHFNPVS